MCLVTYIKHSCGCIGYQVSKVKCLVHEAIERGWTRGLTSYHPLIIAEYQECSRISSIAYQLDDAICAVCEEWELEEELESYDANQV
jgi:hypothetical protein